MKTLLAKFKVGSTTNFGNDNVEANLSPVISDSPENKSFSKYTPSGAIKLHITNPDAVGFFEPAEEYFVQFSKANGSPGNGPTYTVAQLVEFGNYLLSTYEVKDHHGLTREVSHADRCNWEGI